MTVSFKCCVPGASGQLQDQYQFDATCLPSLSCRLDNKRAFAPSIKQQLINAAKSSSTLVCAECQQRIEEWELATAEVDHIMPWSKGGGTTLQNAQLLHM
eukprot:GHUV01034109.1.p1 GENE.GHUV01034109.1~~GHUV01034109.1.p1  ORF type:complete len:100 (+),score=33.68 GHUV01034109.1:452-751(+)